MFCETSSSVTEVFRFISLRFHIKTFYISTHPTNHCRFICPTLTHQFPGAGSEGHAVLQAEATVHSATCVGGSQQSHPECGFFITVTVVHQGVPVNRTRWEQLRYGGL